MVIYAFWAVAWLLAAGIAAVCVTAWDKHRARRRLWRVSESVLWLISVLGGSVMMYVTMLFIRHKTRHMSFMIGLPLLMLAQIGFLFFLWHEKYLIFV